MHPVYQVLGFVLRPLCSPRCHGLLLAGVVILFTGCGQQPLATADSEVTEISAPTEDQRITVAAATTEAVGPLNAEELARKTALETELADERPTHRLKLRDGHVVEGRIVSQTPFSIRFRDGFGYSGFVVQSYKRSDVLVIETLPAASFEVTPRD